MTAMIPDEKKEEIRERADLVEVVSDYVKLKRSGRNWKGLCPFHDEKTPSFNVTPDLAIYKCFGCGASGDVFNFVMEMEGVGFVEAMRNLADRYGVSLPEADDEANDEAHALREGIYHALKYAGVYYHRQLSETDEAEKARQYLQERGYNQPIIRKYGLGYAPRGGDKLLESALDAGLNKAYLLESGLIKPSRRDEGFYDAFRGRLMFPIFSPTGKVIAFAGRALGEKKTAKYINSPQTKVYDKSGVLYGINFAKNEIRKENEAILVEGYTDVISLHQHGVKNVIASSGTSLTPRQLKLLNRYGDALIMIYDADVAGQKAMKRGINLGLAEGLDVRLLELPEGDDPDSFVRQFGKDSFFELKRVETEDFVPYLVHQAQNEGRWEADAGKEQVVTEVLESIAHIPNRIKREVKVQALNKLSKIGDRALFDELGKLRQEVKEQQERARRRKKRAKKRSQQSAPAREEPLPSAPTGAFKVQSRNTKKESPSLSRRSQSRPGYEKELIRLMLLHGRSMIKYIGSHCSGRQFEDALLKDLYHDIINRYKNDETVSVEVYAAKDHPYPELVGEIMLEKYEVSKRHREKIGKMLKRDDKTKAYEIARSSMKSLILAFIVRKIDDLTDELREGSRKERDKIRKMKTELQSKKTRFERLNANELFPDPDSDESAKITEKVFEYRMKEDQ